MKRTLGIAGVLLLGMGLLASCGTNKESQGQVKAAKSKVSSSISKASNSRSTKESTKTVQSSSSIPISTTSSSSISTSTKEMAPTSQSTKQSSSSDSTSEVSTVPYRVSLVSEDFPLTFYYKGFNVPESVTINDASIASLTVLSQNGESTTYKTSVTTVPTKQIRIFSAGTHTNQTRTVKVNTQINLIQNHSQSNSYVFEGPMYLFYNNQGGISLVTPNYAGNVPDNERDVMLEVVQ